MMYDIAALQPIYGANFSTNTGNSVYTWNPSTGEMSINGVGQGAPAWRANRVFLTIWDGGGNDTYDLSNYSGGVHDRPPPRRVVDHSHRPARQSRRQGTFRPRQCRQCAALSGRSPPR